MLPKTYGASYSYGFYAELSPRVGSLPFPLSGSCKRASAADPSIIIGGGHDSGDHNINAPSRLTTTSCIEDLDLALFLQQGQQDSTDSRRISLVGHFNLPHRMFSSI